MTEQANLTITQQDGVTVATVNLSELTPGVTDALLSDLKEPLRLGRPLKVVMDLSQVRFIDSVALGGLVLLLRRIKQSDGRFGLVGVSGHCLRLLEVTGLRKVFDLYEDLATAMGALKQGA